MVRYYCVYNTFQIIMQLWWNSRCNFFSIKKINKEFIMPVQTNYLIIYTLLHALIRMINCPINNLVIWIKSKKLKWLTNKWKPIQDWLNPRPSQWTCKLEYRHALIGCCSLNKENRRRYKYIVVSCAVYTSYTFSTLNLLIL